MMNELSLFSGAGGGLLGTKLLEWRCLGYVEKDDYCQRIIEQRIADGILDDAPIFSDIRAFIDEGFAESYQGNVEIVTAGFPCQPFSLAGKRQGEMDERNMWPATIETIRIVRPQFCLLENVPGLLAHEYFGQILRDLAESGYDARWKVISAAELGAPHKRDRLWIVANRQCKRKLQQEGRKQNERGRVGDEGEKLADADNAETSRQRENGRAVLSEPEPKRFNLRSQREMANSRESGSSEREGVGSDNGEKFTTAERSGRVWWWDTDPADLPDSDEFNDDGRGPGASEICGEQSGETKIQRGEHRPTEPGVGLLVDGLAGKLGEFRTDGGRGVPRVAKGIRDRVSKLKAIGNGQVPAVVRAAWEILTEE